MIERRTKTPPLPHAEAFVVAGCADWCMVRHKGLRVFSGLPCVYVLGSGEAVKIGWSKNVGRRISRLQVANPERLSIVCLCFVDTVDDARNLERVCHEYLADANLRGEWFVLTPERLDPVLMYLQLSAGVGGPVELF